jgi:Holliday junction resolvasome RuvABC endonuclease subunit
MRGTRLLEVKRWREWSDEVMGGIVAMALEHGARVVAVERAFVSLDPNKARAALSQSNKSGVLQTRVTDLGLRFLLVAPQGDVRARQVTRALRDQIERLGEKVAADVAAPRGKHMRDALAIADVAIGHLKGEAFCHG